MKTVVFVAAISVLVAGIASCATTSAPAGPPANVAGWWSGGTMGAAGTSVSLALKQDGGAVTGTIDVGGRPDLSGEVSGSVSGNTLRFNVDSSGATIQMTVSQNRMTGVVGAAGLATLQRN